MRANSNRIVVQWRKAAVASFAGMVLALAFAAGPAAAQVADPHIASVTYGGTGCPQGSVGSSFSNERTSFTLIFDSFVAYTGPAVPITEGRKSCQLDSNITTSEPTTRLLRLDYRGYVSVPAGTSAETRSVPYFGGEEVPGATATARATGPAARDYLLRQEICVVLGEAGTHVVNLAAQARLLGPSTSQSQVTIDSIYGELLDEPCGIEVTVTGVTDGETYLYQGAPRPGCKTTDNGGGISAVATLSTTGTAPGVITATCSGAVTAAGVVALPVSATYTVVCSLTDQYGGTISTKLNSRLVSTSQVMAHATFHPETCELTALEIVPVDPAAPGTLALDTATGWKAAMKTAVQNWTFKKSAQSLPSGSIVINGQPRPLDLTSSLQAKLTNGTNNLYFKAIGSAPNGVGMAKSGFEITTTGLGLEPLLN